MKWIIAHFRNYQRRTPWSFTWRIAIEGTLVSIAVSAILVIAFGLDGSNGIMDYPVESAFVLAVVVAPVFETLALQMLPVALARWLKTGFTVQLLFGMVPFALLHFPGGLLPGICGGVLGGFYLSFTYVHWRQRKLWTAIWTTTLHHALRNGGVFVILFSMGVWSGSNEIAVNHL